MSPYRLIVSRVPSVIAMDIEFESVNRVYIMPSKSMSLSSGSVYIAPW